MDVGVVAVAAGVELGATKIGRVFNSRTPCGKILYGGNQ